MLCKLREPLVHKRINRTGRKEWAGVSFHILAKLGKGELFNGGPVQDLQPIEQEGKIHDFNITMHDCKKRRKGFGALPVLFMRAGG